MKTLKSIFSLIVFTIVLASCTPQSLNDDQNNATETQDETDGSGSSINDGSKK